MRKVKFIFWKHELNLKLKQFSIKIKFIFKPNFHCCFLAEGGKIYLLQTSSLGKLQDNDERGTNGTKIERLTVALLPKGDSVVCSCEWYLVGEKMLKAQASVCRGCSGEWSKGTSQSPKLFDNGGQTRWRATRKPQHYTKHSRQLSKAGSGRGDPQGRAHHLVVQCQQVSPENMHASDIMWTQRIILRNVCIYECIFARHNNWWKTEAMTLK